MYGAMDIQHSFFFFVRPQRMTKEVQSQVSVRKEHEKGDGWVERLSDGQTVPQSLLSTEMSSEC